MSTVASRTRRPSVGLPAGWLASEGAMAAAVGVLTVIAFVLRFSQIHQSLVGDEVFTYQDIAGRSLRAVLTNVHTGGENSPPLFFALAWLTAKLGDPTVWIRLPSIVLGAATIPVIYLIGRQTVGRVAGLLAAALVVASPFSLYYGVEARPYATMAFFVALSTLFLLSAVRKRAWYWWALYAVSAAAAAYSHYTSIFVLGVQAVWSLWVCRDRIRQPLVANALIALLYLPWLPHVRGKALAVIGLLEPLTLRNVAKDVPRALFGYPYATLSQIPMRLGLVVIGVCLLVALIAALTRCRRAGATLTPAVLASPITVLAALAVATPIGLLLYSLTVTDLWLARGLYASVPAASLVLAALFARLPRPLAMVTAALVLITLAAGSVRALGQTYVRPPFRTIAAYLDRVAGPHDPISVASVVGEPAVAAQLHKPHMLLAVIPAKLPAADRRFYLVLDERIDRKLNLGTPHVAGYRIVARQHYQAMFPTDVLVYGKRP